MTKHDDEWNVYNGIKDSDFIKRDIGQEILDSVEAIKASDQQVGGNHYKDMAIQPHYFCHVNDLGSMESNIVKYACRHHQKGGRKDVEKIIHYAQLLLEWEYGKEHDKS